METTECYRSNSGVYAPKVFVEMVRDTYREMVKVQSGMRGILATAEIQEYNRIVASLANYLQSFND